MPERPFAHVSLGGGGGGGVILLFLYVHINIPIKKRLLNTLVYSYGHRVDGDGIYEIKGLFL